MQALQNAHMEAARMEWLNESTLSSSLPQSQFLGIPSSFRGEKQGSNIAWWNRQQVLDNLRAAISAITRATEGLQVRNVILMICFNADSEKGHNHDNSFSGRMS